MKKIFQVLFILFQGLQSLAQSTHPWERPLIICNSIDGINFSSCSLFQDSSGVPSLALDSSGRILCAFQWFPEPFQGLHWDSVAVKISLDTGLTWSEPEAIVIQNFPANFQRPFDPTLVALPGGQIRIYFSSGPPGMNTIGTYSAIGTDGIHYTFEPGVRFSQTGRNCIDPAVNFFQGLFHYTSPKGAPQDGAFHAVSNDGLTFTQLADISSDAQHNWTGNMLVDSLALKFYGTGNSSMWFSSTGDGNTWSPYRALNIAGGDPAVVKTFHRGYIIVYTGPPLSTEIENPVTDRSIYVYPNPAKNKIYLSVPNPLSNQDYSIMDLSGKVILSGSLSTTVSELVLNNPPLGIYIIRIFYHDKIYYKRFCVM